MPARRWAAAWPNAARSAPCSRAWRAFKLDAPPERIEVYDNSHIQGRRAIGAMVAAGPEGFNKNAYRKFNIKTEGAAGDDFAMMREVMSRRFGRALRRIPTATTSTGPTCC